MSATSHIRRRIALDLTDPAYDPIFRFIEVAYPGMTVNNGLRELLLVAAGHDPLDAARFEARKAARYEVMMYTRKKLIGPIAAMLRELQTGIATDAATNAAINDAPENPYT